MKNKYTHLPAKGMAAIWRLGGELRRITRGPGKTFPGLQYTAAQLSAYILCIDFYVLNLADDNFHFFTPHDITAFRRWLNANHITDLTRDAGPQVIMHFYKVHRGKLPG